VRHPVEWIVSACLVGPHKFSVTDAPQHDANVAFQWPANIGIGISAMSFHFPLPWATHNWTNQIKSNHSCLPEHDQVTFGYITSLIHLPLSSVCNVRAPCSAHWNFLQCFYAILYPRHPLISMQNFAEIVPDMMLCSRWYIGVPAKIRNLHISLLYILCEVKFKFNEISMLFPVHWLYMDKHK